MSNRQPPYLWLGLFTFEQGTNLDLLQESIITQAEVMELKGDPVGSVEGYVIESKTDPKRG